MGQQSQSVSENKANLIDDEINRIVQEAHKKAYDILTEHLDELHRIAKAMLEYETLTGDEIKDIIKGEPIRREDITKKKPPVKKSSLPSSRGRKADGDTAGAEENPAV